MSRLALHPDLENRPDGEQQETGKPPTHTKFGDRMRSSVRLWTYQLPERSVCIQPPANAGTFHVGDILFKAEIQLFGTIFNFY